MNNSSVTHRYPITNTMRDLILIALLINLSFATIDINKLTDQASTKLQKLTDKTASKLQAISDQATTKLQAIGDQTATVIKHLVENIDLEKVKQLDFLNLIPRIQDRLHHAPDHLKKVKMYLDTIKNLKGKDLILAFETDSPMRRNDEIYKVYEMY